MKITQHISALGHEAKRFADAADDGGLAVDIATCPGWTMRDLVRHLGEIHLWAAAHVARRATKMWVDDLSELAGYWPDLAVFWPADDDLIDWYLETNDNLVCVLESAPADVDAMTFLPAPSPLAMWARRQAHETGVHRFDAQNAAGGASGFDPLFASDGIDELLSAFAPRARRFPASSTRAMMVAATDTDQRWHVTIGPGGITTQRGDGPADLTLTGTASDLYLALWNRGDSADIGIAGDVDLLATWHEGHRIRWSS